MHGVNEDSERERERRIVNLEVDEVSNVDNPAILREFLIVKRRESGNMGAFDTGMDHGVADAEFNTVMDEVTKALKEGGFEFADLDVEKAMPGDLTNSLKAAVPWMRKMAGEAEGDTRKAILRVVAFLSKVSGGGYPFPKSAAKQFPPPKPGEEDDEEKKKAKAKADEEKEEAEAKRKKEEEEEKAKTSPKSKALSLDGDDDSVALLKMTADGGIQLVTKGARHMTRERTAALAEGASKILGLLKETDEESFKSLLASISKELPANPKFPQGMTAVGTKKSADGEEGKVTKAIDDLGKRLEAIEKARAPSKSVDGDGGTDTKTKKNTSMWGNVL